MTFKIHRKRSESWRGLGDAVHAFTTATGIHRAAKSITAAIGVDCKCEHRREEWNRKLPFDPPALTSGPSMDGRDTY